MIWNTLLDGRFTSGEVRVVIAHELGHVRRNHIVKSIGWYALFAVPGRLPDQPRRRAGAAAWPSRPPSRSRCSRCVVPAGCSRCRSRTLITRHMEAEADWLALQTTRDPSGMRRPSSRRSCRPRWPTRTRRRWEYLLLEDHPTIDQRIAMARAWQARYATSASAAPPQLP